MNELMYQWVFWPGVLLLLSGLILSLILLSVGARAQFQTPEERRYLQQEREEHEKSTSVSTALGTVRVVRRTRRPSRTT